MAPKPNPAPGPAPVTGANALDDVVSGLDTGSGSGGGSSLYGTTSDVLGSVFNVAGLPGLTNKKNPTGRDIIQAFLAAGQSNDPATRNLISAIEYALYQSNYYTSGAPNLFEVTGHDAEALGKALQDLSQVQQTSAGATVAGGVQRMSLSQFLTSQAALAAANGPGSPGTATTQQKVIRTPNPADIASEYRRVAAGLEGKNPNEAETQAFVRQYLQQYVSDSGGSTAANYQTQVAAAQAKQPSAAGPGAAQSAFLQGEVGNINGEPAPAVPTGHRLEQLETGNGPATAPVAPENLTDSMATLQDVLAANGVGGTQTAADPESIDTAAESFARNSNPTAVHQNELGNTLSNFFQILKGIGQ